MDASEAELEFGTRTMVDVLNEQRDFFKAKRDLAKARYEYIINNLALKQATGQLRVEDLAVINHWLINPPPPIES